MHRRVAPESRQPAFRNGQQIAAALGANRIDDDLMIDMKKNVENTMQKINEIMNSFATIVILILIVFSSDNYYFPIRFIIFIDSQSQIDR